MDPIKEALTFDDVTLAPKYSEILPSQVDTSTYLRNDFKINIPLLSSAMDTVTESSLAIKMAQMGGLGIIHKNFDIEKQSEEVNIVKRFESGMVINPYTINPESILSEAFQIKEKYNI